MCQTLFKVYSSYYFRISWKLEFGLAAIYLIVWVDANYFFHWDARIPFGMIPTAARIWWGDSDSAVKKETTTVAEPQTVRAE
jgi:hypothetical protein